MNINCSAKFDNKDLTFHHDFDIEITMQQLQSNKEKVVNLAVQRFKQRCTEYFKIEFSTMIFFEVYFFQGENEVELFKKVKEQTA